MAEYPLPLTEPASVVLRKIDGPRGDSGCPILVCRQGFSGSQKQTDTPVAKGERGVFGHLVALAPVRVRHTWIPVRSATESVDDRGCSTDQLVDLRRKAETG